jgi:hypothetical protein
MLSICVLVLPATALALTYTSPVTTDGVVESDPPIAGGTTWETDELMDNDGDTDFYLTWDSAMVYCAIAGAYADQEDGDYDWFIAIDTDQTPGSGATMDGYAHVNFTGDYLPEFIVYRAGGFGWYETSEWDPIGEAWVWRGWADTCSYGGWDSTLVSEICIPLGDLGNPDTIAVVSWITDQDQTQIVASFPAVNPIGSTPQTMAYFWLAEDLGAGVSPVMLPIDPLPPDAIVDNERSFPLTCTAMADITPGDCGLTTSMTFYYTTDGSDPDENSASVAGTYDDCRVGGLITDTYYAVIPAPDDATVRWIAKGVGANAVEDWSDNIQEFVQGGTAWVGNAGSSPTTCTIWAEIYVGDGGQTTYIKFPYSTDGSDPRLTPADTLDGVFDAQLGNNDKFYAVVTEPNETVINWYAFGVDTYDNYAETDTFYTFVQGDTADYYNMTCEPESNYVYGEVAPGGYGAGMDFHWTTDGTDPKTSGTAYMAKGYFVTDTDTTGVFGAYLTASIGQTIKWYAHVYASDNSFSDTPVYECVADTTSGPILCNLRCVPDSAIVRASISPRGYGAEITFYASMGEDPKTAQYVCEIPGGWVRDEDTPGGDCAVPVGVFQAELPGELAVGDTVMWYAHGWYQPDNKYNGLFGDSPTQTCEVNVVRAGIDTGDKAPVVARITNVPNPFGGSTQIVFDLSRKAKVDIAVYDIRGRMVASVHSGVLAEGEHAVSWNGRSDSDEAVPSGIYFFRFKAGDFEKSRKAMLIR